MSMSSDEEAGNIKQLQEGQSLLQQAYQNPYEALFVPTADLVRLSANVQLTTIWAGLANLAAATLVSEKAWATFASLEFCNALTAVVQGDTNPVARVFKALSPLCGGVGATLMSIYESGKGDTAASGAPKCFFAAFVSAVTADAANLYKLIEKREDGYHITDKEQFAITIARMLVHALNASATVAGLDAWQLNAHNRGILLAAMAGTGLEAAMMTVVKGLEYTGKATELCQRGVFGDGKYSALSSSPADVEAPAPK